MMDIIADLALYVNTNAEDLYATVGLESFGTAPEAIIVRGDPSSAVVDDYIDGSFTGSQSASFYARSKDPGAAIGALGIIAETLDGADIDLTDVQLRVVMPQTLTHLTGQLETGEFEYVMTVVVEYDGMNAKGV